MTDRESRLRAQPGETWHVAFDPERVRAAGFAHQDGPHTVYTANGGQLYFRPLNYESHSRPAIDHPSIVSAHRLDSAPPAAAGRLLRLDDGSV